jgi:hypothetical protein
MSPLFRLYRNVPVIQFASATAFIDPVTHEGRPAHAMGARASGALPSKDSSSLRRGDPPFEAFAGIAEPGQRDPAANAAASYSLGPEPQISGAGRPIVRLFSRIWSTAGDGGDCLIRPCTLRLSCLLTRVVETRETIETKGTSDFVKAR